MNYLSPVALPESWRRRYLILRLSLYLVIIVLTGVFALRVLFPVIEQRFDFRSPGSSKNSILFPRSETGIARTNGKIERAGIMKADTTVVGDFSRVSVSAGLEKKSAVPQTLAFSLRRSYRSFFYPTGETVNDFPQENIYSLNNSYFALREGMLFPFVSERAYLSRYPKERALPGNQTLFANYPLSENWIGFRVGSLLSNATGVFVVTSETEIRPMGSAEIFLALGYTFADVIPASEEELGIYKRGRIFLLGATHPDGTILLDVDSDTYYIVDQGTKRLLAQSAYRDFLVQEKHPIRVSTQASEQTTSCTLVLNIFSTALSCVAPITNLIVGFGNDFEMQIANTETDIDINTLTVSFETVKNKQNMLTLLSQIKQRLFSRFSP